MQTRYRAAATALLLTATAGMAATGGAAEASGTHHTSARAAHKLVVTIKSTKGGPVLSATELRPGKTMFNVVRRGAGGSMQVLRLKSGYSLAQAGADFQGLFTGDVKAVRRIDRNVVFYGGIGVPSHRSDKPNKWGVDIDKADTYYVINIGTKKNLPPTPFEAKGKHQRRALPGADGWINVVSSKTTGNTFKAGANNPSRGWMRTTNKSTEPHFVEMGHVKQGTTDQDVQNYISSGAQGQPPFAAADGGFISTEVVSPGHTIVWKYHTHKGKYLAMCFFPSKADGMPHFLMGMFLLTDLG